MRGLRWWRWGALLLVGVLAALFASLNAGERVALYLGFATLYQIPLVPLILGAFVVGMATMFLLGLRHDLLVRQALRDAGFGEPIAPGESAVTRGGWAASAPGEERPPGTDDDRTLPFGAAGSEFDSAPAAPPVAPRSTILSGHEALTPQRDLPPDDLPPEPPSDDLMSHRPPPELPSHELKSHKVPPERPSDELKSHRPPPELPSDELKSHRLSPDLPWDEPPLGERTSESLPPEVPSHEPSNRLSSDKLRKDAADEGADAPGSGDVANQPQDSEELPPDVHSQPRSPP